MEPQLLSLDRISTLPQPLIDTILCLVPFGDAVSTSILSKKWRYNWAKIPKLVLDTVYMFDVGSMPGDFKRTIYDAIKKVLFLHEGPIHEFTFILNINNISVEIDQMITHLSRNNNTTLKKFKLDLGDHDHLYRLPLSIFSLHQLTDLYLHVCDLDFGPTFSGFHCLKSLHLEDVRVTTKTLLHLLSKSPLLKSFTLIITEFHIYENRYLFNWDKYTLTDLFECLHMIEHFCVSMLVIEVVFCLGVVPRELPPSLAHVKQLTLDEVFFPQNIPFALLIIRSSPNLEKLKLQMCEEPNTQQSLIDNVTYSAIPLEHLREFEIEDFANMKSELDFVKFILTKAPVLEKVSIFLHHEVDMHEEVMMLRKLLRSPRASPNVEIIVERPPRKYKGRIHYLDPL
uniref:F-box/FBD/LRR-repeat protein At1g13570-like n=1 Tax=Erigeron canadensis TaxID=72917 RepID=UPI001CB8BD8D|nr:F-box/FBD/LRR-repeat protein At1g13570-like [Erigeron canadensis]XP_043608394.1 F-box/FBD/LRR-repeat protein At1g13570-like [Erigeron canadensis]